MSDKRSPQLHELTTAVCAPVVTISENDGQIRPTGTQGAYRHDRRILRGLEYDVADGCLHHLGSTRRGSGEISFYGVVVEDVDDAPDPTLYYVHDRDTGSDSLTETWTLYNSSPSSRTITLSVFTACDFESMSRVKSGRSRGYLSPWLTGRGAEWSFDDSRIRLRPDRAASAISVNHDRVEWQWTVRLTEHGQWSLRLGVEHEETDTCHAFSPHHPTPAMQLRGPRIEHADDRSAMLLRRSLDDLEGLTLSDSDGDRVFLAAGSPWFLTLFGRDAIWAARFLLPANLELAGDTLRALAARQGSEEDPSTEEQPGKIPHELRRTPMDLSGPTSQRLPLLYYGTIDATQLWVCLLHEAWRAGLPEEQIRELLPALRAALDWIAEFGDPDGDGFCEYSRGARAGLVNKGWKDSPDGVKWPDGSLACQPLALCEVQGYTYAAAISGAELLDRFGSHGQPWREWAGELRRRFRREFWIDDEFGHYPAIALDGDKQPVAGPASNMAHLLGTGMLDRGESEAVARQLADPGMCSGYGLRTLSARTEAYNPFGYHCGSVWPHDTAIAVLGLAAEGHHGQARELANNLVRAAGRFNYRMPELFSGTGNEDGGPPLPYPSACSPQAWAAAASVAVVEYLYGRRQPNVT